MNDFLSRVDISIPLDQLITLVAREYNLGNVKKFEYIKIGFEDLNIKLETERGKYVVKIFSKLCDPMFIKDYIEAILKFRGAGIPTPIILKNNDDYLFSIERKTRLCVMEYFEGNNFDEMTPHGDDFRILTKYLAKIHKFSFKIHNNYDKWATSHLLEEFPKKKKYLSAIDLALVQPVIDELKVVDFGKFKKSIIHGAFEKSNILKNNKGDYCILDLGCMDFNASVIDLAIFLAAFCLAPASELNYNKKIKEFVIKEYLKTNDLTEYEIQNTPLLIRATYAAYILIPSYLLATRTDTIEQVNKFLSIGREGVTAFQDF